MLQPRLLLLIFILGSALLVVSTSYVGEFPPRASTDTDRELIPVKTVPEEKTEPEIITRPPLLQNETEENLIVKPDVKETLKVPIQVASESPPTQIVEQLVKVVEPPVAETVIIQSESIVGLNCFYRRRDTGEIFNTGRGSGVIINPRGYILTARHVVDYGFGLAASGGTDSNQELANASDFERCDVGIPNQGTSLPDAATIRKINPSTQLAVLGYTAKIAGNLPAYSGKLPSELLAMDYAVLRIDGVSSDGPFFGINSLPATFRYSEILLNPGFLSIGEEILTYGFPGDTTSGKLASFSTLYLVGSVGTVDKIFSDGFIQTKMEVSGGRSGSPLFWKGRVAGIVTSYLVNNRSISRSLGVTGMHSAIKQFLP